VSTTMIASQSLPAGATLQSAVFGIMPGMNPGPLLTTTVVTMTASSLIRGCLQYTDSNNGPYAPYPWQNMTARGDRLPGVTYSYPPLTGTVTVPFSWMVPMPRPGSPNGLGPGDPGLYDNYGNWQRNFPPELPLPTPVTGYYVSFWNNTVSPVTVSASVA